MDIAVGKVTHFFTPKFWKEPKNLPELSIETTGRFTEKRHWYRSDPGFEQVVFRPKSDNTHGIMHADNSSSVCSSLKASFTTFHTCITTNIQNLTLNTTSLNEKKIPPWTLTHPLKNVDWKTLFLLKWSLFRWYSWISWGVSLFVTDYLDRKKISAETPKRQTAWFPSRRRWSISVEMASHSESELVRVSTRRIMRSFKGRVNEPLFCRGVDMGPQNSYWLEGIYVKYACQDSH